MNTKEIHDKIIEIAGYSSFPVEEFNQYCEETTHAEILDTCEECYKQGVIDTLKKACEFLEEHTILYCEGQFYFSHPTPLKKYTLDETSIEKFKKAMEE